MCESCCAGGTSIYPSSIRVVLNYVILRLWQCCPLSVVRPFGNIHSALLNKFGRDPDDRNCMPTRESYSESMQEFRGTNQQ